MKQKLILEKIKTFEDARAFYWASPSRSELRTEAGKKLVDLAVTFREAQKAYWLAPFGSKLKWKAKKKMMKLNV